MPAGIAVDYNVCMHPSADPGACRADSFKTRQLYHGGPVSHRHLHLLHSCPEVEGSNEVLEVSLATSSARVFSVSLEGVLDY